MVVSHGGRLLCKELIPKIQIKNSQERNCAAGQSPISVSVSDLCIPTIDLTILLQEICGPILGIYKSLAHRHMKVETGTEAAQFPENEYINGIFVAVWSSH
jgi:hypothetical protein